MNEWVLLAIGVLLTLGTGVFVASEFALVNLDRNELEARQSRGERGLTGTISALKRTSTHLSSAQLGITLTTLLTGYTMEPAIGTMLAPAIQSWGIDDVTARAISAVVALALATLLSMIVGELVPKNFALAVPLATAKLVTPLQRSFTWVFRPAVALLNGSANGILRMLGIEPKEELSGARTADELTSLVRRSATEGLLDTDAATLLSRTLRFTELTAADIMTPRPRVATVDRGDTVDAVINLAASTGFSRFPIVDEDLDRVVGLAHVKMAVAVPRDRRGGVPVKAIANEDLLVRVPESMTLDVLLGELRQGHMQMAVVVDEYGGTAGIATLEDLVEELVGEVRDEHDRRGVEVVRVGDEFEFPAIWRPDELIERAGVTVEDDGPYETVGGYIMAQLGRIPTVGDEVPIEHGTLTVTQMDGRRVDRARFTPAPVAEEDAR